MSQQEKRSIGMNLSMPLDLSIQLSRKVLDYRQAGIPLTKETLLLRYASMGLAQDVEGDSMPIVYDDSQDGDERPVTGYNEYPGPMPGDEAKIEQR